MMPTYTPGKNIAMKLPVRSFAQTVSFYQDTLGLETIEQDDTCVVLAFGDIRLHLDSVPHQSQPDIWLEVSTDDTAAARKHLTNQGIKICDEVETLPKGFDGFWIAAPSGTIHLIDAMTPAQKEAPNG